MESRLQSLGFAETNGKLRFNLDDVPVETTVPDTKTQHTSIADFSLVNANDSSSFVVLGKSSMDLIEASSMASYVDIQQKSMSVDYESIVSSLSPTEIQQKLTELLQENIKLKETLKQNNTAMKQQFNTLATWQEEVMKIHKSHKQKFAETRELVDFLKKENAELKLKLSIDCTDAVVLQANKSQTDSKQKTSIEALQAQMASLIRESDNSKHNCEKAKLQSAVHASQLCERKEKVGIAKDNDASEFNNSIQSNQSEKKYVNEAFQSLRESIVSLEQKLEHAFTPIQIHVDKEPDRLHHRDCQRFVESAKEYDTKLRELTDCFISQINRFAVLQNSLKELTDLLDELDNTNDHSVRTSISEDASNEQFQEKMRDCYRRLIDEQVKIIGDRQTFIRAQNHFQRILSDYNSLLNETGILLEENAKLSVLKNNVERENLHKMTELQKDMEKNRESLQQEKDSLDREKSHLEEEKRLLDAKRTNLNMERESLTSERELLKQERIDLLEEKTSLDRQSQLYENYEKVYQTEKKVLENRCGQLVVETFALQKELQKKNRECEQLIEQLTEIKQQTENIELLKTQLVIYEDDFKQERKSKESLMDEKSKLDLELHRQIEYNKDLEKEINRLKGYTGSNSTSRRETGSSDEKHFSCPKCQCMFTNVDRLKEHVERCLDLH